MIFYRFFFWFFWLGRFVFGFSGFAFGFSALCRGGPASVPPDSPAGFSAKQYCAPRGTRGEDE
jgi:hypothetical protein